MAMMKCPECGKEISDKAAACIHCGNPVNREPENKSIDGKSKANPANIINLFTIIGVVITFVLMISFDSSDGEWSVSDYMVDLMMKATLVNWAVNAGVLILGLVIWFQKKQSAALSYVYFAIALISCIAFPIATIDYSLNTGGAALYFIVPNVIQVIAGILYVKGLPGKQMKGLIATVIVSLVLAVSLGITVSVAAQQQAFGSSTSARDAAEASKEYLEYTEERYEDTLEEIDEINQQLEELEKKQDRLKNAN